MPDLALAELPRIVLVFGDEAAAAHVREAMRGQADIVYAAPAGQFDASRLDGARAALVNLDDGDWLDELDGIETKLNQAGVAVVFNDPDISTGLEGWERARWVRHLAAKLRGSNDVDPPRPTVSVPVAEHAVNADIPVASPPEVVMSPGDGALVERPLSPEEIENMTADFVAEQEPADAQKPRTSARPVANHAAGAANPISVDAVAPESTAEPVAHAAPAVPAAVAAADATNTPQAASPGADFDGDDTLDVDTETLSAMIDARLAAPESQAASDSTEVWRVVSGGPETPLQPEAPLEAGASVAEKPPVDGSVDSPAAMPADAARDDSDVLAGLPSLDDWQLVDRDAPVVVIPKAECKSPEPVLSNSFAGLELVPIETIRSVEVGIDPTERWMGGAHPAKPEAETVGVSRSSAAGGKP